MGMRRVRVKLNRVAVLRSSFEEIAAFPFAVCNHVGSIQALVLPLISVYEVCILMDKEQVQ